MPATRRAAAIGRALWERVVTRTSVVTMNHVLVTELLADDGVVRGARFFDAEGERHEVTRAGDAARDRRRRPGLSRDDQPGRGDR